MGSLCTPTKHHPWIETPLLESSVLSSAAGCRIFLKLENLQPASSFKSRGIGNLILSAIAHHDSSASLHFYSSSGGNAGLACVTAARTLGYPASVAVPSSTDASMIAKIRAAGAMDVMVHGATWFEADKFLREEVIPAAKARGLTGVYVPPFNHEDVWEGNGTMIEEIYTQLQEQGVSTSPDAVVCSVGGGGLFVGIVQGVEKVGWKSTRIIATETRGADSLSASLQAGQMVTLPGISSIAKSLGATRVAERAFELAKDPERHVSSIVLSDAEACMACVRFADDTRILVEPACGVSVAMCYDPMKLREVVPGLNEESVVVIVVCGGCRISLKELEEYKVTYAHQVPDRVKMKEEVPSEFTK